MKKRLGIVLTIAVILLFLGMGTGWWYYTSRPEYLFAHGKIAAETGDFDSAEQYAADLEEMGQVDLGLLLHGTILAHQGLPDRALGFLKRVEGSKKNTARAAILAGQCYIALKNPREAERALLFTLNENPDEIDAHRWLAVIYYDQGDLNRARSHCEEVARLDPTDEKPHFLIGTMYRDLEFPDEAVKAFQESLRRNPNGPRAIETRIELAEAQLKNYQEVEAIKSLEGLDTPKAIQVRAEALIPLGRVDESVAVLDEALKKYPNDGGLLRLRGERYRDAGNFSEGAKLLERALAQDPGDARTLTQLALCYTAMGRAEEAALQNQKAEQTRGLIKRVHVLGMNAMKDPWDAKIREELADLCEKMDRPQLAKMWRNAAAACQAGKTGPPH
jgi:tetratricopeptide (TPR) repeat protein